MPNYKNATETALKLLKEYKIDEPIIPVFEIAERLGVNVVFADMPDKLKDVSGFLDPETRTIYVNHDDPPTRQAFTTAHELGHFILNHEPDEYGVLYRYATPIDPNPIEQEANCFAANLLVPEEMLKKIMSKYSLTTDDVELLAKFFGVSTYVMKYRLKRI